MNCANCGESITGQGAQGALCHECTAAMESIARHLATGNRDAAIEVYRNLTGLGRAESALAVDELAIMLPQGWANQGTTHDGQEQDLAIQEKRVRKLVRKGQLEEAAELHARIHGCSAREAEAAVEALAASLGHSEAPSAPGESTTVIEPAAAARKGATAMAVLITFGIIFFVVFAILMDL